MLEYHLINNLYILKYCLECLTIICSMLILQLLKISTFELQKDIGDVNGKIGIVLN